MFKKAFGWLAGKSASTLSVEAVEATAKGVVKGGADKVIVIGEGMGAVKETAMLLRKQGINAKWYQAWSKNFPGRAMTNSELQAALSRNKRWIETKIKQGYKIYDIGIDPTRMSRSPFYMLEQEIINKTGYPVISIPR